MIRSIRHGRLVAAFGLAVAMTVAMTSGQVAASAATTVDLRIIGMNDLHGNLQPPAGSSGRVVLPGGGTVDAGGVAFMATHINQLRQQVVNSVVVAQGDLIGASPLAVSKPITESLEDPWNPASPCGCRSRRRQ